MFTNLINKLPPFLRNKYVLVTLVFLVWLLFFDKNNLIMQFRLSQNLEDLKEQKEFYEEEITNDSANLKNLMGNPDSLEKFAREKFLMKKENEDVFLIIEE
ncbi:MAG: septum formation initiator family protein [Bacteroidales bacterium]|nr:septum formation initiator family protein [Bacteroidales bacterium]